MTTIGVCLPEGQARALKALAVAMDQSASAVMRSALDDYIAEHRAKRASLRHQGRVAERAWEVFDLLTR